MKFGEYESNQGAKAVGPLVGECLREMGLAAGLNSHKVFRAWDDVSGAADYTLDRAFRGGCLYVRLSSSVMRSELRGRLGKIRDGINIAVSSDPMFTRPASDREPVKKIILQ